MLQCPNNLSGIRRGFRHLLVVATLVFLDPAAPMARTQDHSSDDLRKLNQSVDALIKRVAPSVVQILVTGYGPLEEGDRGNTNSLIGRQRAIGSGFVIDASGYIVTNAHVVSGAERVQVVLPDPMSRARSRRRSPRVLALFPPGLPAYRKNSILR